jgi:hypothetical protein
MSYLLLACAALAMADEPQPTPKFESKLRKANEDTFESSIDKNAAAWKIKSKSGIGGATVDLKSGPMPKKVVIRFVGMRSLESFTLTAGDLKLQAPAWRDAERTRYFDDRGRVTKDAKASAGSLTIERKGDDIEVVLVNPAPCQRWSFGWIDAFRK